MNKMVNRDIAFEREREFIDRKLLVCPFYGTSFCEEDENLCLGDYEKCDRLNKLTTRDYLIK
jgi:hypothetical protein